MSVPILTPGEAQIFNKSEIHVLGQGIEEFNPKNFTYFVKPSYYDMSNMKLDGLKKLADIIQWGRRNPTKFVARFIGAELLDLQKEMFMKSWITPFCVWCMSRDGGKSIVGAMFLMTKTLLVPYFEAYILCGNGAQSIGLMSKIEKMAKNEIASFTGLTDVFLNEMVRVDDKYTGISHNPSSWSYSLHHGSTLATINSNYDGARFHRSRLNFYDEASYTPSAMYDATEPFTAQNADFKLGGGKDVTLMPPDFANQTIYASSAGSMDDVFYKRYKEYSLHMLSGDRNYYVCDIDCDMVMSATFNGKKYPVSLLTQEKIDNEMRMNPIKATREYKNKFDADGSDENIIKRAQIIKNSIMRPPILINQDESLFVLAWDLAAKKDNSILSVGRLFRSEKRGWMMEVCNCINLLDKKTRKPLTTPEQIDRVREELINYNGKAGDYANIEMLMMDAGSGGGATQVCNFLFNDFYEKHHDKDPDYFHCGLIDKTYEYCKPYISRYPTAVDKLRMIEPSKYKVKMYTELIELVEQGLITFPMEYDYNGYLTLLEDDGEERIYKLTPDEEVSLKQIDAMKEEVAHMYRYKSSNGNIRYDLAPGLENTIGDDRSYTLALLAHALYEKRASDMVRSKKEKPNTQQLLTQFTVRAPKKVTRF